MPHERMFHHHHAHKLDDPERARFLPAADVVARLALKDGLAIADVGAGTGYFSLPLARAVGSRGRVFAVDMQPEMLDYLRAKLTPDLPVTLVQGTANATTLASASVDLVFYANVWHEIDDRPGALVEAKRVLRPGGRVAIVDWRPDVSDPEMPGPPLDHRVAAADAARELRERGLEVGAPETVGTYHYIVAARVR